VSKLTSYITDAIRQSFARIPLVLVLLLAITGAASGAPFRAPTPQAFADELVALYGTSAHTPKAGRAWDARYDALYDPALRKLIDQNSELAGRLDDLSLDHDPLCGCQDGSGQFHVVSIVQRPNGLANVSAKHCYGAGECAEVELIIKSIAGSWRFYDALENGSLRQRLARQNACMHGAKTQADGEACLALR
jgi:hypothetical protein